MGGRFTAANFHVAIAAACHERPFVSFTERTIKWLLDFETRPSTYAYNSAIAASSAVQNLSAFLTLVDVLISLDVPNVVKWVLELALRLD